MPTLHPDLAKAQRVLRIIRALALPALLGAPLAIGLSAWPWLSAGQDPAPFAALLAAALAMVVPALWVLHRLIDARLRILAPLSDLVDRQPERDIELTYPQTSLLGLLALRPPGSGAQGPAWRLLPLATRDRLPRPGTQAARLYWDPAAPEPLAVLRHRKLFWGRVLDADGVRRHGRRMALLLAGSGLLGPLLLAPLGWLALSTAAPIEAQWKAVRGWQAVDGHILASAVTETTPDGPTGAADGEPPTPRFRPGLAVEIPRAGRLKAVSVEGPWADTRAGAESWLARHPIGSALALYAPAPATAEAGASAAVPSGPEDASESEATPRAIRAEDWTELQDLAREVRIVRIALVAVLAPVSLAMLVLAWLARRETRRTIAELRAPASL